MKRIILLLALACGTVSQAQNYQYLSTYDFNGVPNNLLTPDVISTATMSMISASLPESYPVPTYNPQYISSGYDTDIKLTAAADVYVTFVTEGASYQNVLGFYTYSLSNPPTSTPSTIKIVFPNVSLPGSGGALSSGSKVKIGSFPAGTGIGWVLISNGWTGWFTGVGNGLWKFYSNPNFNPESSASKRQHNVLLNDTANQRVILGFEDVKRDLSSCDHDFNDAVFYVTANSYTAINAGNIAPATNPSNVSSGNDGGLESNGSLAGLIAKRNFGRVKNNTFMNKRMRQAPYATAGSNMKTLDALSLETLFPSTGMYGTETTFVSTPQDLVDITNATDVFSVDYYSGDERVAAALGTMTTGSVYDHSKMICDRLNGSSLEDVRTVELQGHEIIMVKLKRNNGESEYALTFSVEQAASGNILHSYWNIAQYPAADYLNIQVWGSSMGQVCSIVNNILDELNADGTLTSTTLENRIPSVFVKQGVYSNGHLNLEITNRSASTTMAFEGNKRDTEVSETANTTESLALTGDENESVTIETGGLFDIGFSVSGNNSPRLDGLYLADGPWGVDYDANETTISSFDIEAFQGDAPEAGTYNIERNATLTGTVKGTVNLFRNVLPGELTFDATGYEALNFELAGSHPVEVVMVTEGLTDWSKRLKVTVNAQTAATLKSIALSSFTNADGVTYNGQRIKGFVFSVIGNYTTFEPFNVSVSNAKLGAQSLGTGTVDGLSQQEFFNYPNPFGDTTTLVLPADTDKANVQIIDVTGRVVYNNALTATGGNTIQLTNLNLIPGTYIIRATTADGKVYQSKCIKQ